VDIIIQRLNKAFRSNLVSYLAEQVSGDYPGFLIAMLQHSSECSHRSGTTYLREGTGSGVPYVRRTVMQEIRQWLCHLVLANAPESVCGRGTNLAV
jgi:hypothetical protein